VGVAVAVAVRWLAPLEVEFVARVPVIRLFGYTGVERRVAREELVMRRKVFSGAPWEKKVAYCRAARVGNLVFVSGTTAIDEKGKLVGGDSLFAQADYIFEKISRTLTECGASIKDVVRTRSFLRDMNQFDEFAKAHKKYFQGIDPVATCVQVSAFVDPKMMIEIEVDAVVEDE
jgi:enamine deaminase RidA (YjgF/YER057c/UK114 family)